LLSGTGTATTGGFAFRDRYCNNGRFCFQGQVLQQREGLLSGTRTVTTGSFALRDRHCNFVRFCFQGQVLQREVLLSGTGTVTTGDFAFRDRYCNNLTMTAKTGELLDVQRNKVADKRRSAR